MSTPAPENIDEWDDEQIEEHNQQVKDRLDDAIEEETGLSDSEQDALEKLSDSGPETESVEFSDEVEVDVRVYLNDSMEQRIELLEDVETLQEARDHREDLITVLSWLIMDDDYGSKKVWSEYAECYGTNELMLRFLAAVKPALDRAESHEAVRNFR